MPKLDLAKLIHTDFITLNCMFACPFLVREKDFKEIANHLEIFQLVLFHGNTSGMSDSIIPQSIAFEVFSLSGSK